MLRKTLTITGVGALCAAVLTGLAVWIRADGAIATFDRAVWTAVVKHRGSAWTHLAKVVTTAANTTTVIVVATASTLLLLALRRYRYALVIAVSCVGGSLSDTLAKQLVGRSRPPRGEWLTAAGGLSFPSGHAAQSVACYVALGWVVAALIAGGWLRVVVRGTAVMLAIGIGLSRIYLGVHWASDVLGGWSLGAAVLAMTWLAAAPPPRAVLDPSDPE